jgi:Mn-dependent DtxR family transcriptional regulator
MRKKTIEDYVEIIYKVQEKKGIVHTNDIASAFHINPASVTEIFQKLNIEDYIHYKKYSGVILTDKGRQVALKTIKKHNTLKSFLMLLGLDEKIADEDACKIEHNVNKKTIEKLNKFVEYVNLDEGCTRWLDHFAYFEKTGKYIVCTPKNQEKCPIHLQKI